MPKLIPDTPCPDCMQDPQTMPNMRIGRAVFCPHRHVLAIWDDKFDVVVSFTGVDLRDAADITAAALTERLTRDAEPDGVQH